jgi:hypothetical protein
MSTEPGMVGRPVMEGMTVPVRDHPGPHLCDESKKYSLFSPYRHPLDAYHAIDFYPCPGRLF